MPLSNPSYETAGLTQGSADDWTATITGAATAVADIDDGTGVLLGWEGFEGWVSGQGEYRFDGFDAGDTTVGTTEAFAAWVSGQEDYRDAFASADTTPADAETFEAWASGQGDYRFSGFEVGDKTAGTVETFGAWIASQSDYRAEFQGGDTTTGSIQLGPGATGAAETFGACRSDVAVQATASSTTIAAAGHDFSVSDPVQLTADGSLLSPFQKGITYYVKTIVAGVSMTLSATDGGAAITATATGEATLFGDPDFFWRNPRTAW